MWTTVSNFVFCTPYSEPPFAKICCSFFSEIFKKYNLSTKTLITQKTIITSFPSLCKFTESLPCGKKIISVPTILTLPSFYLFCIFYILACRLYPSIFPLLIPSHPHQDSNRIFQYPIKKLLMTTISSQAIAIYFLLSKFFYIMG